MRMLQVANSLTARSLPKVVRRDLTQDINTEHHNKVPLCRDCSPLLSLFRSTSCTTAGARARSMSGSRPGP